MNKYIVLLTLTIGLIWPSEVFSQQEFEIKEPSMPASGSLASTRTGMGSEAVQGPWAPQGSDLIVDEAPVSGSISRISPQFWKVRVFNNTQERFYVSLELQQLNANSQVVQRDSFSYNLRAKETIERDVRAHVNSSQGDLLLRNWRKEDSPQVASEDESPSFPEKEDRLVTDDGNLFVFE
jgi:hypothetical protein